MLRKIDHKTLICKLELTVYCSKDNHTMAQPTLYVPFEMIMRKHIKDLTISVVSHDNGKVVLLINV